jgi:hypothetical protein
MESKWRKSFSLRRVCRLSIIFLADKLIHSLFPQRDLKTWNWFGTDKKSTWTLNWKKYTEKSIIVIHTPLRVVDTTSFISSDNLSYFYCILFRAFSSWKIKIIPARMLSSERRNSVFIREMKSVNSLRYNHDSVIYYLCCCSYSYIKLI